MSDNLQCVYRWCNLVVWIPMGHVVAHHDGVAGLDATLGKEIEQLVAIEIPT